MERVQRKSLWEEIMDINKFISDLNKNGVAKASNAKVLITRNNGDRTIEADMVMRIKSVEFPGKNITQTESNYSGLPYKIATGATMGDVPINVILSENFKEKEYFESWQDDVIGKYRSQEISSNSFNLNYYKNYIGTVDITQYNELGNAVFRCQLIDAYPNTVGNLSSDWDNGNEILILPVTFSYRYYKNEELEGNEE
jgi:hypothetical protein